MKSPLKWIYNVPWLQQERKDWEQQEALKKIAREQLLERLLDLDDKKSDHTIEMDDKWVYDTLTTIDKFNNRTKLYNTKIAEALNIKR